MDDIQSSRRQQGGDFSSNRRKYPRVPTESLISIAPVDARDVLANAVDLSIGGIRFRCLGLKLEQGEMRRVQLSLDDRTVSVVGRIVRVTELDAFAQDVGLAFVEVDPETLHFLEAQLAEPLFTDQEAAAGLGLLEAEDKIEPVDE